MKFNVTITDPSPLIALGSLIFNGTSIWLYSTYDPQYVPFHVYLDSLDFASVRLPVSNLLYHGSNLDGNEQHTVTVQPARILESVIVEMDFGDKVDTMLSMDD
ncbi:hypothetical protein FS837_009856, partial [Tulasnella sp. UAMH 9824]